MFGILHLSFCFTFNAIKIPFDNGANMKGSSLAPDIIVDKLPFVDNIHEIKHDRLVRNVLGEGFMCVWKSLNAGSFPIVIGGDHTVAISSVFAANEVCLSNKKKLGILWCDAHADFNTIETSLSKNLHGVPVAVLCGHTLPLLSFGTFLNTDQFAYYGVRDIDELEQERMEEFKMVTLKTKEIEKWMAKFDKIHISFDIDCISSNFLQSVNTPVNDGPSPDDIKYIFRKIKESGKLFSLDVVEFNPTKTNTTDDLNIICDVLNVLF